MAQSRQCPTRVDGGDSLIAHSITLPVCRERQREHYHKCYACVHRGSGEPVPQPKLAPLPESRPAEEPAKVTIRLK